MHWNRLNRGIAQQIMFGFVCEDSVQIKRKDTQSMTQTRDVQGLIGGKFKLIYDGLNMVYCLTFTD